MMIHKRVKFQGEEYWLHDTDGDGFYVMLSPIDHYSDDGELLVDPLTSISFAVVEDENIVRYGEVIGNIKELQDATDSSRVS